jgi:hypothetical protein
LDAPFANVHYRNNIDADHLRSIVIESESPISMFAPPGHLGISRSQGESG